MNSKTLHIDELLNNSFAGFEPTIPTLAWDGIADKLDAQKRKKALWLWSAAALLLVLSSSAALLFNSNNSLVMDQATEQSATSNIDGLRENANTQNSQTEAATDNQKELNEVQSSLQNNNKSAANKVVNGNSGADFGSKLQQNVTSGGVELIDKHLNLDFYSLGISFSELPVEDWMKISTSVKLDNNIGPVKTSDLGKRFYMGLGVGQLVTATGFNVNPDFGNYVHKNFTKRMSDGEGLLASLSFNTTLGYRIAKNHSIFVGVNYYQRKNSLNFNFTDEAPALNAVNNPPLDKFGRYPIKDYLGASTVDVSFKGTNTFTAIDFPIGWMGDFKMNRTWSFVPVVSANLGMLNVSAGNTTLDYQFLDVVPAQRSWYKRNYLLMNTSAGIYKNIGQRIKWGVNATANYTVTQMYISGASIRPRAFTGGFTTQLIWRLD